MTGRASVRAKTLAVLTIAGLSFISAHYPNHYLSNRYGQPDKVFGASTVFCNHLDLIEPVVDRFIHGEFVAELSNEINATLDAGSESWWSVLGYNGDHCLYLVNIPGKVARELQLDPQEKSELLFKMFAAGVMNDPVRYAWKIFKQYGEAIMNPYARALQRSAHMVNPDVFRSFVASEDYRRSGLSGSFNHAKAIHPLSIGSLDFSWIVRFPLRILHELAVWLLLGFVMLLIVDVKRRRLFQRKQAGFRLNKRWQLPLLAFAIYTASLSVVAAVHTFDIPRYSQACSMLALYFHICTLDMIGAKCRAIRRLVRYRRRWQA